MGLHGVVCSVLCAARRLPAVGCPQKWSLTPRAVRHIGYTFTPPPAADAGRATSRGQDARSRAEARRLRACWNMSADPPVSMPPRTCSATPQAAARPAKRAVAQTRATQPSLVDEERRQHERAVVSMQVHVVTPAGVVHCIADNLSAGGALLCGAPALDAGSDLVVVLRLRGHAWHVRARVLRVQRDDSGQSATAVAFPGILPKVQDLIQSYVLSRLRHPGRVS